jgi:hypothetical protein
MRPTLRPGGRVVLYPVEPSEIRPQDVIAFRADGQLVLHRVHVVWPDRVLTAGDNVLLFDRPVWKEQVIGIARDVARMPAPLSWPQHPQPANADIWLIGADADVSTPPAWRVHRRPAEGVGVSASVLEEIHTAVAGKPCIGVSEHAVYSAREVLEGGLPPDAQVIIGGSFGRLHNWMSGHLIPTDTADAYVRLGPPQARLTASEALRRLTTFVLRDGLS